MNVIFAGGGTGGHLYPALALGAAMQELDPAVRVHYVGARRGVEVRVLPAHGVEHTLLPVQPIQRDRIWRNWRLVPAMTGTTWGLAQLFRRLHPKLVVGTGGYASGPACLFGAMTGVPMAIQEQNSHPGFTTRMLSRWADQVHLGFPEAGNALKPGRRTKLFSLGNPIKVPDTSLERGTSREWFGISADAVVLLVVGGSQGSRAVNESLLGALELVAGGAAARPHALEILWATGPNHFDGIRQRLDNLHLPWVKAVPYIDDMSTALASADVAVSRAGAMATAELLAWGRPMLLIPLPTAAADHQTHNAIALEQAGAAVMLKERELTPAQLWHEVTALTGDHERRARMETAARERARPEAAREIARELLTLVRA